MVYRLFLCCPEDHITEVRRSKKTLPVGDEVYCEDCRRLRPSGAYRVKDVQVETIDVVRDKLYTI